VLHLAARVGGLFANMNDKVGFYRDNMRMNENVIHTCYGRKVEKCVSCLSTCIFPDIATYPMDEDTIHKGLPHTSNFGYSFAKRVIDVQNRIYNDQFGCNFTSVVPCNVYGPHDQWDLSKSHVIPGLIHKAYLAKQNGQALKVFGSGKPLRQFIFSEDLARLMIWALREYNSPEPIILSVSENDEVTIGEVSQMVSDLMDIEKDLEYVDAADGQHKKTVTNAKLRGILPNFKFTPLSEGLKQTVDWFNANYETCRK
jgi:GDP-L-fucose synthase